MATAAIEDRTWHPRNPALDWATRAANIGAALRAAIPATAAGTPVSFEERFTNRRADAITAADIADAAATLGVSEKHIHAVRKVESGPFGSFDRKGRPIILFEPHVFSRLTGRKYDRSHPRLSYKRWGARPYPKSFDARWRVLAEAAALDEEAALGATSWGLFQVLGLHAEAFGYDSVLEFVLTMVRSEAGHLKALVDFVRVNDLSAKLRACKANDPQSCVAFVKRYNGSGYARNRYHIKLARALR